jgi:hypothetical protein
MSDGYMEGGALLKSDELHNGDIIEYNGLWYTYYDGYIYLRIRDEVGKRLLPGNVKIVWKRKNETQIRPNIKLK